MLLRVRLTPIMVRRLVYFSQQQPGSDVMINGDVGGELQRSEVAVRGRGMTNTTAEMLTKNNDLINAHSLLPTAR